MTKILFVVFFLFFSTSSFANDLLWEYGDSPMIPLEYKTPFVLTSWNIYKGGYEGLYEDLHQLVQVSDFMLMQEFLLNDEQLSLVHANEEMHWALAKSFENAGEWTGVATMSNWEAYESLPIRSPGAEPITGTPKMSLISKFKVGTGELWIINLHALNFNITHEDFKEQVSHILSMVSTYSGPLIFAGDFNTWSDKRRVYLLKKTRDIGLIRVDLESPMGIFGKTLDHIFYRDIRVLKAEVLTDIETSDHHPLQIHFEL